MNRERNIQDVITELREARDRKDTAAAALKEIEREVAVIEEELFDAMEKAGVDQVRAAGLTVSMQSSTVPKVTNWEDFERYVHRFKAFHLFERRVHTKAWREECDARNGEVPGVEPFTKVRLNVRAAD